MPAPATRADKSEGKLSETSVARTTTTSVSEESSSSDSDSEGEFDDTNGVHMHEKHRKFHCVIRQESLLKKVWDVLFGIVLIYVATLLPFKISFIEMAFPQEINIEWWNLADVYFFDWFFILDLLLNFFFTYNDDDGHEVRHLSKCALRYLRGCFLIDFIACIPSPAWEGFVLLVVRGAENERSNSLNDSAKMMRIQKMTKIARLVRLTRLMKIVTVLKDSAAFEKMNEIRAVRMMNFMCALTFLVHVFACMWYYCATLHTVKELTWVAKRGLYDGSYLFDQPDPVVRWVHSMYFVLTVITSVGYGDMCAYTSGEMVFVMMLQLVGVFVSSTLMSLAIQIAASGDEGAKHMVEQKKIVRAFAEHTQIKTMRGFELGESLSTRVRPDNYDRAGMRKLLTSNVFSRECILQLPKEVFRGELVKNKFVRVCRGYFRSTLPPRLTVLLALACQQRHFMPEEFVYFCNDQSWTIFLIYDGIFSHVAMPSSRGGQPAVTPTGLRAMAVTSNSKMPGILAAGQLAGQLVAGSADSLLVAGSSLRNLVGSAASASIANTSTADSAAVAREATKAKSSKVSRAPSKATKASKPSAATAQSEDFFSDMMSMVDSPTIPDGMTNLSPYQIFCKGNVLGEVEVFLEDSRDSKGLRKGSAKCERGGAGPAGVALCIHKTELHAVVSEFPPCGEAWRRLARRREEHRKRQLRKLSAPCTYLEYAASTIQSYWRELRDPVLRAKRYEKASYKLTASQRRKVEAKSGKTTPIVPAYVKDLQKAIEDIRAEVARHEETAVAEVATVRKAVLELHRAIAAKLPPRSDGCKRITQGRMCL